jgi:hypothetical protein
LFKSLGGLFAPLAEVNQRLVGVTERLKPSPAFDVGGQTEMEPTAVDADATILSDFRPHPACPDGAQDGGLNAPPPTSRSDPIRLGRMVKQIMKLRISFTIRTRRMGSGTFGGDGELARHRLVHPGEPDGANANVASFHFGSFPATSRMAWVVMERLDLFLITSRAQAMSASAIAR